MHHDQAFVQPDFTGPTQHDMAVLMGSSGDIFGYPMSAPAAAPANFWDPSVSMGMDLEFNAAGHHAMPPPTPPSHRHTGSFDWNADIQLFQDVAVSAPSNNQETVHQVRRERALAPKPPSSEVVSTSVGDSAVHLNVLDDPFGIINPGDGVDPGLLFGRPHVALTSNFGTLSQSGPAEVVTALSGKGPTGEVRKATKAKAARNARLPDRAPASSPIKPSVRPGLGRSYSENRGKRLVGRKAPPIMAEAGRPAPPTSSGHAVLPGILGGRPSGRVSPSKTAPRLSSLASIPETSPQCRPRTSVRFTIDASGRARAETTVIGDGSPSGPPSDRGLRRSRSSREVASRGWDSSDDDSSTDDEPIIIPSRCSSFNASFALPDPRKPVGSIFHAACRDMSDRSRSNSANGAESDAETVVNDRQQKGGDATSELRRVVEDRQKWSGRTGSARSRRFISTNVGNFPGGIISPTSLAGSSHGPSGQGVRCVCEEASADEADGFMLQCESCEMWLHGKCINITRWSMPSVYICCFCANTPNTASGRRGRESGLGIGGLLSPLANRPFRSFR
ncbi:PHD finger domain protein [Ophiocordyceps sinensis CO18]|uniref:PHD finger domain protein n=1 Tax=Ophiocordyceps sinensis (strain Co18 / CGMCC 3.14243) TaxID=911162 RepID=T5AGV7_OPHSC|nr:PHD finger domain protein [Ophiocordyceps sinensis CO18]